MTLFGKILAVLNVVAALAFATLLVLAYGKRQQFSNAVFVLDVKLQGLPLEMESLDPTVPRDRYPSQFLDDPTLKAVFAGAGEPVKTLEEEVQQLQNKLPGDIDAAVSEAAGQFKNDGERRNGLQFLLLPLARTGPQLDALKDKMDKAAGPALDVLVQEAVRRHLINDLLDPLQQLSPAEGPGDLTPRIAELDGKREFVVSREKLDEFLSARIRQIADPSFVGVGGNAIKWDAARRRQIVSDLIFAIDHLTKPRADGRLSAELLNERGPERAQVVLGLVQYNASTDEYAQALEKITRRIVGAIEADRDGVKGKLPGFVGTYREQVAQIRRLAEDARDLQRRLDDVKGERKKVEDDLATRKAHHDEILKKIMDSRAETLKLARQLQHMQQQLFVAQREIAAAFDDNTRMLQQIRELEGLKKGAQ